MLFGFYVYWQLFNGAIAGFEKPSAIQQRAIKPIVRGRDVIAQYVIEFYIIRI